MRKLSQLDTNECVDVLCEITPYICNIVTDEEIINAIGKAADRKERTPVGMIMDTTNRIAKCVPFLLKTHKNDVYTILASVGGVELEEIAAQNIMVTLMQIRTVLRDRELMDFFKSWAHGEKNE